MGMAALALRGMGGMMRGGGESRNAEAEEAKKKAQNAKRRILDAQRGEVGEAGAYDKSVFGKNTDQLRTAVKENYKRYAREKDPTDGTTTRYGNTKETRDGNTDGKDEHFSDRENASSTRSNADRPLAYDRYGSRYDEENPLSKGDTVEPISSRGRFWDKEELLNDLKEDAAYNVAYNEQQQMGQNVAAIGDKFDRAIQQGMGGGESQYFARSSNGDQNNGANGMPPMRLKGRGGRVGGDGNGEDRRTSRVSPEVRAQLKEGIDKFRKEFSARQGNGDRGTGRSFGEDMRSGSLDALRGSMDSERVVGRRTVDEVGA